MYEGMILDSSFVVDLFAEDNAARALAGEAVLAIPAGVMHRMGKTRTITPEIVAEFAENFGQRSARGIRRSRLAVDVNHEGGAVGWYKNVQAAPEGVMASFTWTQRGREILEAGEYAYFSALVYWEHTDRVTGDVINNQLAGGALTNYPFFGEATALYSLREGETLAVMKREGDAALPARAYLVVEDPEKVGTWHLPVYSWQGGALKPDHGRMSAAKAALTSPGGHRDKRYQGPQKEAATTKLRALYEKEGLEFNQGGKMAEDENTEVLTDAQVQNSLLAFFGRLFKAQRESDPTPDNTEQLATFAARVESLSAQVATLEGEKEARATEVVDLGAALEAAQLARATERFAVLAEGFAYLPVATGDLAGQLQWLAGVDGEDKAPHVAFFTELLRKADAQFAEAFEALGGRGRALEGSPLQVINQLVAAYQADHQGVAYAAALKAVLQEHPQIYQEYMDEVVS